MDDEWVAASRNATWITDALRSATEHAHVVIVGCGGLGALFAINATHVGFRRFTCCDSDTIALSDFNRHIAATRHDIGRLKTDVIREHLVARFTDVAFKGIPLRFPNEAAVAAVRDADIVIGCVDNAKTRIELDIICRRTGRTLVDLGSGFEPDAQSGFERSARSGGQVYVSRAGGPCLQCLGFGSGRVLHGYFRATETYEPSSLLINEIVAALGVETVLRELSSRSERSNRIAYVRETSVISVSTGTSRPGCLICAEPDRKPSELAAEQALLSAWADVPCNT
jgi:threonine dehydrogenase-like Zn-dependent dehydrogenase